MCVVTRAMAQQQSTNTSGTTNPATSEMKTKHGKYNFSMVHNSIHGEGLD